MQDSVRVRLRWGSAALLAFAPVAHSEPGEPVGPVQTIASEVWTEYRTPAVAMSDSGQNVVVYTHQSGVNALIARYQYPPSWMSYPADPGPFAFSCCTSVRTEPAVAMSRYGYWMAAWFKTEDVTTTLYGMQLRGLEPVGPEFPIAQVSQTFSMFAPRVATNGSGSRYTVAWTQRELGSGIHYLRARVFDSNQQPVGPEHVIGRVSGNLPAAVAQTDSHSVFAWKGYEGSNALLLASLANDTGTLSSPVVADRSWNIGHHLALDLTSAGDGVLAYERDGQVRVRQLGPDLVPLNDLAVADSADGWFVDASIASDGRFLVAWKSTSGELLARAFAADGTPVGSSYQISAEGPEQTLRLASDASGDALATWDRGGKIYARRIEGSEPVDVLVDAVVMPQSIQAGTNFRYHIDVRNVMPTPEVEATNTASGVFATVVPPTGSTVVSAGGERWVCLLSTPVQCTYDDVLAPGQTARLLNVEFQAPVSTGEIVGSISVGSHQRDPDASNNVEAHTSMIGDTEPDHFYFSQKTHVPRNSTIISEAQTITGITVPAPVSISPNGAYSINGATFTSEPGSIHSGDNIRVSHTSAATFSTEVRTYVTVGSETREFRSTTERADYIPNNITFYGQSGVERGVVVESNTVIVSGINVPIAVTVTGGEYSLNGAAWTAVQGVAESGDTVRVRHTTSTSFSTATSTRLVLGSSTESTFLTFTMPRDVTPNAFSFLDVVGVPLNATITSNEMTVDGINDATPISVAGGSYSIDGGAFTSASATVANGQRVRVQLTTASAFSTATSATLTIGGVSDTFSATTEAQDTTPAAFVFADQIGLATNVSVTSAPVTITGINAPATASVTGGEMSVNGGAFGTTPAMVNAGDQIRVRHTTSSSANTGISTTVTVGGVSDTFTSTTGASDTSPNAFAFADVTNAKKNQNVTSAPITVGGINTAVAISIAGGGASYSINGGAFRTTSGTVSNGQTVTLRLSTPNASGATTSTTVTIGGLSDSWSVTTR